MIPNPLAAIGSSISLSAGMPMIYLAAFLLISVAYALSKILVARFSYEFRVFFKESLLFLELSIIIHMINSIYALDFSVWPWVSLMIFLAYLHLPK